MIAITISNKKTCGFGSTDRKHTAGDSKLKTLRTLLGRRELKTKTPYYI